MKKLTLLLLALTVGCGAKDIVITIKYPVADIIKYRTIDSNGTWEFWDIRPRPIKTDFGHWVWVGEFGPLISAPGALKVKYPQRSLRRAR